MKEMPVAYFRAKFDCSQSTQSTSEHSPIVVDYRSSVICRNATRCFRRRACVDRAQIYCVCACVWRRSRSRFVQRSDRRSRRVNWFRAREYIGRTRACTHEEQRWQGRRERRKRASEKERKRKAEPRGRSHPEFEVGRRTCNRVS